MTLITRKKLGQEAQIQRQEVRQLREILEHNRPQRSAPPSVKSLASALFKGWTPEEIASLDGQDQWLSVDRKRLKALYEALEG